MKTLKTFAALAACIALLPLTGCSEDDNPTNPGGGGDDERYVVTVTLDEYYVVGTCDFLNAGEFDVDVKVRLSGGSWIDLAGGSVDGATGESYPISDKSQSWTLDGEDAASIEVDFEATEMDWDIINGDHADDRMDERSKINVHAYNGNGDWDLGSHTITLGNEDGCKIRLEYTVQSERAE